MLHVMSSIHAMKFQSSKCPYSKVHWTNMGPILGRQDPCGPHVGPMNFAEWFLSNYKSKFACMDAENQPQRSDCIVLTPKIAIRWPWFSNRRQWIVNMFSSRYRNIVAKAISWNDTLKGMHKASSYFEMQYEVNYEFIANLWSVHIWHWE